MTTPLRIEGLSVTYPNGHRALHEVSLSVDPGQRCGLVGRSGCGKSTLVRAVLGLLPRGTVATGSVRVGDVEVLGAGERALRGMRGRVVGYVPQDPFAACDPLRSVGHHVAEAWTAHRTRPPDGAVAAGLAARGIVGDRAGQFPHQWSGGMLQRATLVAATAHRPLLTVADEPTSALDAELADDMLTAIRAACQALLLVSHDLALVARHTDQVVVLDDGHVVEQGDATRVLTDPSSPRARELVAASVAPVPRQARASTGKPVSTANGVRRAYGAVTAVDGVDLTVHAGEVVGIVGRSGSGKSTLARLVAGMERPDAGSVRRAGDRPGYVMPVFQDPVASLDRRWPLWRTLAEPARARGERGDRARWRALAVDALAEVGLSDVDPDRRPGSLSVGQAQRVAIARALAARPALLVADEPTAALDVATASAVVALLRAVADAGTAVLVVSHDLPRLRGWADRIHTMTDGRLRPGAAA